jgi:hypothetical protein
MVESVNWKAADPDLEMRGAVIRRGDGEPQWIHAVASGTSVMLKVTSNPEHWAQVNSYSGMAQTAECAGWALDVVVGEATVRSGRRPSTHATTSDTTPTTATTAAARTVESK